MRSIGANPGSAIEVGVATSNGKAYFRIASLLKRINIPYADIILGEQSVLNLSSSNSVEDCLGQNVKLVITTRKERLQILGRNVVCVEDLGDDVGIAKQKIVELLYPPKTSDWFVVGIDPGERTGVAAFINHREVESSVLSSVDDTVNRVSKLIDNSPQVRRMVRIGSGNPKLARQIAYQLDRRYEKSLKIQLVDESGTSSLNLKGLAKAGTRDQRAAKLIAFREGQDYASLSAGKSIRF